MNNYLKSKKSENSLRNFKFLMINKETGDSEKFKSTFEIIEKYGMSKGTIYNIIWEKPTRKWNKYSIEKINEKSYRTL